MRFNRVFNFKKYKKLMLKKESFTFVCLDQLHTKEIFAFCDSTCRKTLELSLSNKLTII